MVVSMAAIDDHERKICNEFAQLLEQSKTLFNGLRLVAKNVFHLQGVASAVNTSSV